MLSLVVLASFTQSKWSAVFAGDLMLNGIRPSPSVLLGVAPVFRNADVSFANVEIPLTNATTATARKTKAEIQRRDQFVLKADPGHARMLRTAGIRMASLGNNHAMDYGLNGLQDTRRLLLAEGISFAGAGENEAEASKVATFRLSNGRTVGLVSAMAFVTDRALWKVTPATLTSAGVYGLSLGGKVDASGKKRLQAWIGSAKAGCDVLVVGVHWGIERKTVPTPYQVALGRAMVEAGADVVWGHHPHVLQGAELYRGAPIFYSMGNLVSGLPGQTALLRMTQDGTRKSFRLFPANIRNRRVRLSSAAEAKREVERFKTLCLELKKRYPHRDARPLPL